MGEKGLTDSQCVALAFLRQEGILDNRAYRNATGVDSRVATSELRDLVARELVIPTGTRRWARYQLAWRTASWRRQCPNPGRTSTSARVWDDKRQANLGKALEGPHLMVYGGPDGRHEHMETTRDRRFARSWW